MDDAVAKGVVTPEAAIGIYVTSQSALLQLLSDRRRSVAIISAEGADYQGVDGFWSGTGFLVGANLLLTNHHVLNSIDVAKQAKVEFNYEISPESLLAGDGRAPQATQTFAMDPARLFITSPTVGGLDYTFVWVEDAAAQTYGAIAMERAFFTVSKGESAFIIHHPDGQPKQVSLDDTDILSIDANVIHYSSDTMKGSSGAPVFDRRGRLIGLHHASRAEKVKLPDGGSTNVVNEGIKIAAIALDLEMRMRKGGVDASFAETVLKSIKGSDTMSGFFGGLGRRIDTTDLGPEAVVDTYRGSDQDVDIGFWNIEWLANRYDQPAKLDGAAKVISDLSLDIWGLAEISPPAVDALVKRIQTIYGDHYDCAFSEPNAAESKQSTAIIWKSSKLSGERVAWPAPIEKLLKQRSDDPNLEIEALNGKIFDRYPGLFRLKTIKPLPAYEFFVVPLHLKAMAEGTLRRRLASRILARAIEQIAAETKLDVILGGDMNAPLASGDFTAIADASFDILGAEDEADGAFTYVKSPKSAIDNVFLSPSMRQTVGTADFFIVAKDRTMPNYLEISDHRPVAVRLSLSKRSDRRGLRDQKDLDALIDALISDGAANAKKPRKKTKA
ncbi:trypsin-like peptidase domain-containing protein [Rhizobium ruizarguesonis]|uniref:trypsin-like peptidase domain-containing protein n=1 Tax=Rhizobium ruizarguesonis TaxID=2081791 RepID=UPI0013EEE4FE|nr:trypsin-like peptidase domain-containing protein [Rhizobium ruizarguesonis]